MTRPFLLAGIFAALLGGAVLSRSAAAHRDADALFFAKAAAKTQKQRTRVANLGIAIDGILSDGISFIGSADDVARVRRSGIAVEAFPLPARLRDFPAADKAFHDYAEMTAALDALHRKYPSLVTRISIGKSLEGRELHGVRISSNPSPDSEPTTLFLGCHHAREHLSVEIPLKLAEHLASSYGTDERIRELLDTREVWIVPMVNPDGAEHDISSGSYRYWRKNRSENGDGSRGVDLNRNYGGPSWGGAGASGSPSSDTYRGPEAFSEPETQAVRDFVRDRKKATTLLTFHTYSELILWPWGYTNAAIADAKDRAVFETMGRKMATWNKYKPQKSSQLYITSGDTTDWAYNELGIFAFTFELTPNGMSSGGFYPGAKAIEPTFRANLEPALYLIEHAGDPYAVVPSKK